MVVIGLHQRENFVIRAAAVAKVRQQCAPPNGCHWPPSKRELRHQSSCGRQSSPTVCSSEWLSLASIKERTSSSEQLRSPKFANSVLLRMVVIGLHQRENFVIRAAAVAKVR